MLEPIAVTMAPALRRTSRKRLLDRVRRSGDLEELPWVAPIPVHADPITAEAGLVCNRRVAAVGLDRRGPCDHVVAPVPEDPLVLGCRHGDADEAVRGVPVDAGLIQAAIRIRFLNATSRLITDDG